MKRLWSKKKWLIGLVVLAVALLGAGITVPVLAASGNGTVNTYSGVYLDSPTLVRLARVLGLTPEELTSQLQTGKTLFTIAQERNIPTASLTEAIIALYAGQVALQLKYDYITQEQSQALLDDARQRAGYLLTQNLSTTAGYNNNGYFGHCGGYWGCGYGSGYGWGMMGPGMMGGWEGYYNNPTTTPGSNPATTPGVPGQSWNGGRGWGMMGGGMMGRW